MIAELMLMTLFLGIDLGLMFYCIGTVLRQQKLDADQARAEAEHMRSKNDQQDWINVGEENQSAWMRYEKQRKRRSRQLQLTASAAKATTNQ